MWLMEQELTSANYLLLHSNVLSALGRAAQNGKYALCMTVEGCECIICNVSRLFMEVISGIFSIFAARKEFVIRMHCKYVLLCSCSFIYNCFPHESIYYTYRGFESSAMAWYFTIDPLDSPPPNWFSWHCTPPDKCAPMIGSIHRWAPHVAAPATWYTSCKQISVNIHWPL